MEFEFACIQKEHISFQTKNQRMLNRTILNRIIILGFMMLVGWCLARGIYYGSVMGIILAVTSLGAAVYFLYLVANMKEEREQQQQERA
jgi:hypothetical protein